MKLKNQLYKILVIPVAALLMGGCKIGKQYTRPQIDLPSTLDSTSVDTVSIGDYPWEQLYTDTILQQLIQKTLDNNKDMLIAAAKVKELAAMKRIDYANLFPQVGLKFYAEQEGEDHGGGHYKSDDQYDIKLGVTWEIDLWGNLRWAKDKSMAEFMGSIENQRALKMSLVAQVAQSYFELVALDNELSIVKKTVDARRESLHLARIRYEGGLTSEIAFLAGEYPHDIKRTVLPEDVIHAASLPVGLPSSLLERRPDVRQAEQAVIAANAAVGIAYTNMFPKLTLTASHGSENDELSHLFKLPHYLLAGTILQPIFAMGKNRAMLKAKKAACEQAAYAYEKVVLNAFKDAYNAIAEYNKVKEIYETRLRLEQSSKITLDLAQLQYINGVIGYMDLLDAQRGYLDAQIGLSNAVRDKQITMVNLYKALGGGWQ